MKIYFPSTFGDINIKTEGSHCQHVILTTTNLTVSEEETLKEILKKFKSKVIKYDDILKYENEVFEISHTKIEDVHKFMIKKLKKNKATLTAIKLKDGKLELVDEIKPEHKEKADKGVTTEKPRRGCPMPSVTEQKEVRASEVLKEFLTQQQIDDFNKYRSFISIGNYTHHPYLVTSRWSPKVEEFGQVYDLVHKHRVCTSCKEIPPSEEMLSMKLSVELNEYEFINMPIKEN